MEQQTIFYPVFVMLMLTMLVWVYLYVKRIPFINSLDLGPNAITAETLQSMAPPAVSNPSDNFKNLFEVPILFYFLTLYLFVTEQVDLIFLTAAWVFAGFRVLHSLVHCTFNAVMLRFTLYAISTLAVWVMVIKVVLQAFV